MTRHQYSMLYALCQVIRQNQNKKIDGLYLDFAKRLQNIAHYNLVK